MLHHVFLPRLICDFLLHHAKPSRWNVSSASFRVKHLVRAIHFHFLGRRRRFLNRFIVAPNVLDGYNLTHHAWNIRRRRSIVSRVLFLGAIGIVRVRPVLVVIGR